MQLRKCVVDVNFERQLLALIATELPCAATAATAVSGVHFDEVLVYFHGFPDMAVHPTKLDFESHVPLKLADAWLSSNFTSCGDVEMQEIDILRSQRQGQQEELNLLHFQRQKIRARRFSSSKNVWITWRANEEQNAATVNHWNHT